MKIKRERISIMLERNLCKVVIIIITLMFLVPTTVSANDTGIEWETILNFKETNGKIDYVVFGEAPDANDGEPPDSYDKPKPPAPMQPYLRAWFDDNLSVPYGKLWEDFRRYPGTEKTWNLSVEWVGSSSTEVTISWDITGIDNSEYNSVVLYSVLANNVIASMLIDTNYVFSVTPYRRTNFQVIATKEDPKGDNNNGNNNGDSGSNDDDGNNVNESNDGNEDDNETSLINDLPVAVIDCQMLAYINESILFDGTNSTDDGTIIEYAWDFGDNYTNMGRTVNYTYLYPGNYTVLLTITDDGGLSNTTSVNVTILIEEQNEENKDEEFDDKERRTPGFEMVMIFVIVMFLFWKRKNR